MALGLGDLVLRFAIQPIPNLHCAFRAQGSVSLLPHFARPYDGHFYHDDLAIAEIAADFVLGAMVGQEHGCRRRAYGRASSLFRRLLGGGARARRPLDKRIGRTSVQDGRKVLRCFLVSALPGTEKIIR